MMARAMRQGLLANEMFTALSHIRTARELAYQLELCELAEAFSTAIQTVREAYKRVTESNAPAVDAGQPGPGTNSGRQGA